MKKLGIRTKYYITSLLVLVGLGAYAQIELLYDTDITLSVQYFKTDAGIYYYYTDVSNKQVVILNRDMSVYKKVNIDFETNYPGIRFPSDKLFNDDSSIEFVVSEYTEIRENNQFIEYRYYSVLYNENGEKLYGFGNRYLELLHDTDGETRLFATSNAEGLQVYKLPGKSPVNSTNTRLLPTPANPAYPNPSTTTVNLPYKLEQGSSSLMSIYSAGGSLIDQKQLDANIDRIRLDVSNYQTGVYMYEYDGISNRFVVH